MGGEVWEVQGVKLREVMGKERVSVSGAEVGKVREGWKTSSDEEEKCVEVK